MTSGNFSDREISRVGCKEIPTAAHGVLVKYPMTEGLAWRDRLRQWTRWVIPVTRDTGANGEVDQTPRESEEPGQLSPPAQDHFQIKDISGPASQLSSFDSKAFPEPEFGEIRSPSTSHGGGWSPYFDVQSSALIGSVLYNHSETLSLGDPRTKSFSASTIRSFSTFVPNISRILTKLYSRPEADEHLILRFTPNPFAHSPTSGRPFGSATLRAFPPIELRFRVDPETKALNPNFIRAIVSTENSDLMLPDAASDIRFQQRTTSKLWSRRGKLPKGMTDFLEASNLTVDDSQGELTIPPTVKIPIATFLCNPLYSKVLNATKEDDETHNVEYLFAGFESRKTIVSKFQGWRLLYSSVDAGKSGGRKGELRLLPQRTDPSNDPSSETYEAFLATAYRLADSSFSPVAARRVDVDNDVRRVSYSNFSHFARMPKITFQRDRDSEETHENGEGTLETDERWM